MITIRKAEPADAERLREIYSYYVKNTVVSFEVEPPSAKEFRQRMERTLERYPYLVLLREGRIEGYAYAGPFRGRAAYDWSCETTVYLDPDARKQGLGRRLMEALEAELQRMGIVNLYACIGYPEAEDEYLTANSADFHAHMGYEKVGDFRRCGYKFGRWYGMIWMAKTLGPHETEPEPIVPWPACGQVRAVEGAVLGFAAADALGVPVEFTSRTQRRLDPVTGMRGGGVHRQPAGTWSDDTSMTLCLLRSLLEKGLDYEDQMARFADWMQHGAYTANGLVFDVGNTTRRAIWRYLDGMPALSCGDRGENSCGNGSLMRIMPLALWLRGRGQGRLDGIAADLIHRASDLTHAHPLCEMVCGIYCSVIFRLCDGGELAQAVRAGLDEALAFYEASPVFRELSGRFASLREIASLPEEEIRSGGFALHTLQASLWCLLNTGSYAECVLRAVNLGEDTDTTAAVAGALAGLWYGAEAIPADWLRVLARQKELRTFSRRFARDCLGLDGRGS